ncbi:MAG: TonB-dependent receptor [Sphingomonas sp.]
MACALATPVAARAQTTYQLDLPRQPLAVSLRALASATGANLVFKDDAVKGVTAPALHGRYTPEAAFRYLLRGTGLPLEVTAGGTFLVGAAGPPTPPKGSGSAASSNVGETGTIDGRVVGAGDDRSVAGALVRLEPSGQSTKADNLGAFSFHDVPAGTYTLSVSFLGLAPVEQSVALAPGQHYRADIAMTEGVNKDLGITVYGSRSARANALNLQRTAENDSDVISADDLGNFTGTTFSDALRRAPGVSFQRDALTGDGTNVVVRGLDPDMNAVKLNGIDLPVGNGTGRSADLSNLLADSVSKITISKSLLPSQDSAGTGGLIEIETLSPLNRPHRYANLQVEGGNSGKGFSDDFLASGTVAAKFGASENFGLSASVQYRRNSVRNISYNTILNYGAFLPPDADGLPTLTSTDAVDPLSHFPFVAGDDQAYPNRLETSFNHVRQKTLAATLSAEWKIGTHTDLKFDFQHDEADRTTYSLTDIFAALTEYSVIPGGDAVSALHLDLSPGNAALQREQQYSYDPNAKTISDTYSFNGKTDLGKVSLKYLLGYAHGSERHKANTTLDLRMPDSDAQASYFLPAATDASLGYIVSPFGPRTGDQIPIPLLSQTGWSFINDPSHFTVDNGTGQIDSTTGLNNRYTGEFSARWDMNAGVLKYVEAGFHYQNTTFKSNLVRSQFGGGTTIAALGLPFGPSDLGRIGIAVPGFSVMSETTVTGFLDNLDRYIAEYPDLTLTPIVPNPDQDKQKTAETNYAAYLQTRLQFGKLEVIGGVRYDRTDLLAKDLIFPTYIGPILPEDGGGFGIDLNFQNQFTKLVTETSTVAKFLPRILFNYRESDNLIFRGGYYLSVARPQIGQLSTATRITFINIPTPGPDGVKPIVQINSGNPNLRPAMTDNFDLSAEFYHHVGVIKLSAFYKRIHNLLQANEVNGPTNLANVTLPDSPYFQGAPYFDPAHPENYFINGGMPANSNHIATIWGIEAQVEQQLTFLPGALNGFGVFANYTFTKSSRAQQYSWAYAPADGPSVYEFYGIPFNQQPKHSGTAALTYNKYNLDATLAYSFQSRALSDYYPRGLSVYQEGVGTLDFRAEYYLRPSFGKVRVYVEASDLLRDTSSPDVQQTIGGEGSTPAFYTRATYLGGRKFKVGVAASF